MTNQERIIRCFRKGENGETLTVGFFGGSITMGSLASSDETCYAYLVYKWWKEAFPKADIHYVNGGIGGTSSYFGAARVWEDLLMYRPDFVVVDFSVNDEAEPMFRETFESVLRRILQSESEPAVMVLNNVYYDTGSSVQDMHNEIARHYGLPTVSVRDTICQRLLRGEFQRPDISPDGLHPNDRGHRLVADEIIRGLAAERKCQSADEPDLDMLPLPATDNTFENACRYTIANSHPDLKGFFTDPDEKMGHRDFFRNGWVGRNKGDIIRFRVTARNIAVQYRKTVHQPSPVAELVLDGDYADPVVLNGNFEETWGDCLFLQSVLYHGILKEHELEIRIIETEDAEQVPFYLLAVIGASCPGEQDAPMNRMGESGLD